MAASAVEYKPNLAGGNSYIRPVKRLGLSGKPLGSARYDRLAFIVETLLQAVCIFLVAPRLARES